MESCGTTLQGLSIRWQQWNKHCENFLWYWFIFWAFDRASQLHPHRLWVCSSGPSVAIIPWFTDYWRHGHALRPLPFFFRLFVRRQPQLACWTLTLALLVTNLAGTLLALNYKNLSLFSCLCYKPVIYTVGLSPYLLPRITPASSLRVVWRLHRVRTVRNPKGMSFMRIEGKLGWRYGRKRLNCLKS